MEQHYIIEGNKLTSPAFEITFENVIQDVIYYDKIYIIILSIGECKDGGRILGTIFRNIYGVSEVGDIIWRIGQNTPNFSFFRDKSAFVIIRRDEDNSFHAVDFFANEYTFDYRNGDLLTHKNNGW